MKTFVTLVCLLGSATEVYAHVEDMPVIIHLADHGGMGPAFMTLLLLLLPLLCSRSSLLGLTVGSDNSWVCSQTALSPTDC